MPQSQIRWSRSDFARLGRAVSDFNKKKREIETEENKLYLPDEISYKEIKSDITTRRRLNQVINSLRRFIVDGAENIIENSGGMKMTRWEAKENAIAKRVATRAINRVIRELATPNENGYSRIQMGSNEYRKLTRTLESFKNLDKLRGYEYERLKNRINFYAQSDLTMKKSITYRENYLEVMEKYSMFDNYDLLKQKLESITNPINFYNFVSATENTKDLTWQSDQTYTQEAFNEFLQDLGIEIKIDSITNEGG